jgi:hypothetical protein
MDCITPEFLSCGMKQDAVLIFDELIQHGADARLLFAKRRPTKRLQEILLRREAIRCAISGPAACAERPCDRHARAPLRLVIAQNLKVTREAELRRKTAQDG